jgi:hypothetical protein
VIHGERSAYTGRAPAGVPRVAPVPQAVFHPHPSEAANAAGGPPVTAKTVLDAQGPEAVAQWVLQQPGVLLTDTTMRDAHQSLLATRVRTVDIVEGAKIANQVLSKAFSFECWGGATYDVAMRCVVFVLFVCLFVCLFGGGGFCGLAVWWGRGTRGFDRVVVLASAYVPIWCRRFLSHN